MNPEDRFRIQLHSAWCGVHYVWILVVGWALIAGFIPPHRPAAGAAEIAAVFQDDHLRIRIGMILVMIAAVVIVPFVGAISQALSRIEGGAGILTYTALVGGAGTMVLTFYPAIWWLVAAFRPERPSELVYLMNDMAWLQLIGGVSLFFALPASIAVAAFCDKSPIPVFPRWAGFFNIWVILIILPDQLLFFFHSGPFSWNGIFGLWLPLALFGGWFLNTSYLLRKALIRERQFSAPDRRIVVVATRT